MLERDAEKARGGEGRGEEGEGDIVRALRTSLRRTEVLARRWSTRARSSRFLNAESAALNLFALEALLGSVGLIGGHHLDEAEAARLLGVGVAHDLALLDFTVLLEKTGYLRLGKTRMDTSNEQVRSGVHGAVFVFAVVLLRSTASQNA